MVHFSILKMPGDALYNRQITNDELLKKLEKFGLKYGELFKFYKESMPEETYLDKELFALKPEVVWLLPGLIPEKSICLLASCTGGGKTFVSIEIGNKLSRGEEVFLGGRYMPSRPIKVLLLDAENGIDEIARRYQKMVKDSSGRFCVMSIEGKLLDRTTEESKKTLLEIANFVKDNEIELIILDPLRAIMSGEENSSKEMANMYRIFKTLRQYSNTAILLNHHFNKQGNERITLRSIRGSTVAADLADAVFALDSKDQDDFFDPLNKSKYIDVIPLKMRRATKPLPFTIKMEEANNVIRFSYVGIASQHNIKKSAFLEKEIVEWYTKSNAGNFEKSEIDNEFKSKYKGTAIKEAISGLIKKRKIERVAKGKYKVVTAA